MTKEYTYLYPILIGALIIQAAIRNPWIPDLVLLLVVFAGVFRSGKEYLVFALVAGLLRGCFSPETFYLDVFLMPAAGFAASIIAGLFYKYNPVIHMVVSGIVLLMVISIHAIYLNSVFNNDVSVVMTILKSWRTIFTTIIFAPVIFGMLRGLWRKEE